MSYIFLDFDRNARDFEQSCDFEQLDWDFE